MSGADERYAQEDPAAIERETVDLAKVFADEVCEAIVRAHSTVRINDEVWLDPTTLPTAMRQPVANAVHYLNLRGRLRHNPAFPALVQVPPTDPQTETVQ